MNRTIDYAAALRRNAVVALAVAAATLITTLLVTAMQQRIYEAEAQLIVAPGGQTTDAENTIRSVETLDRRTVVATFARIASTPEVRNAAAERAGIPRNRAGSFHAHGSVVPNTNIIRIEADGPEPKLVAALANEAAALTAQQAQDLYRIYTLRFLSRASAPEGPASPDKRRNLLIGLTLAVFLGAIAALAADRFRTSGGMEPEP